MKLIKNVFLNSKENQLRLADIYFDDKIIDIEIKHELDYNEISSGESRRSFIKHFQFDNKNTTEAKIQIIDGKFLLAIPGAIDSHVHFDTPGFEFREDFEHASSAAAFGGVTTIIDMPCTSIPPVTNQNNFNAKLGAVQNRSIVDFSFYGGVGGNCFVDHEKNIAELKESGVAGIKVYTISGMTDFTDLDYEQIKQVASVCKKNNLPLAVHAEDKAIVISEENKRKSNNENQWFDYTASRNTYAEILAVKMLIEIADETKCKMLIVHVSSSQSVELIWQAQQKGVDIFAETCPHYLYFTEDDFNNDHIRNYLKTAPPVKSKEDKFGLCEALSSNKILFVNTDHAGCNPIEEKISENFWEVYGGIPGIEHRVPFLFSEGFMKNKISLEQTVNYLAGNQADFFNLKTKGKIEKSFDADFCLINLWESEVVQSTNMHSKGKYTPFEGLKLNSIVEKTFLRGELIMDRNTKYFTKPGYGRFIKID